MKYYITNKIMPKRLKCLCFNEHEGEKKITKFLVKKILNSNFKKLFEHI